MLARLCRSAFLLVGFVFLFVAPLHAAVHLEGLHRSVGSKDFRVGTQLPLPAATALVSAQGWRAQWNRYGTVHTLQSPDGTLATGLSGTPEVAARAWIKAHRTLFRLSESSVDALELLRSSPLNQSDGVVLLFRQRADGVPVAYDGRIKIGLVGNKLFWVASSSIGDIGALPAVQLTPAQAWVAAASAVPLLTSVPVPSVLGTQAEWHRLQAVGFDDARVRSGLLGLPGAGAVPVFEANVIQRQGPNGSIAYTAYVAADDGRVLLRQDRIAQLGKGDGMLKADRTETFSGDYPINQTGTCGPCHGPYTVGPTDVFARLVATAIGINPVNDITIDVYQGDATCNIAGNVVAHADTATSPEAATYAPVSGTLPQGDYYVEVCPYSAGLPPTNYNGSITFSETATPQPTASNAKWKHFAVTPPYDHGSTDTRVTGCWFSTQADGSPDPDCDPLFEYLEGSSHRIPWDYIGAAPTQTTSGNNAQSFEGWNVAIGGGSPYQPPKRPGRDYLYDWGNTWYTAACNPSVITHATPASNDIDAAVTNLFVLHNRLHDFAYQLGLRERNGVAQTNNFGQTEVTREQDQELGFAQAGAVDGGFPSYLGRDNANQATLQDGVAPFSNMYLWQTIGGAAYAPCVDGDFDGQIVAHEYGHMVQSRMTDPDQGLSGQQGRSMGEGWSDLNAVMFFDEYGMVPEGAPDKYAMGGYVSNDFEKGIRNYAIATSPLMLSDVGYDHACEIGLTNVAGTCEAQGEVHSDAEPWTAVLYNVREALIEKYDALGFPSSDTALKRVCAEGVTPAHLCAGTRRWSQLIHDGMILQPPSPTYLDARDAILAADLMRNASTSRPWPSNQNELWTAFARRGLGAEASTTGADDTDPVGGWDSPLSPNVAVTLQLLDAQGVPVVGEAFVGVHEARSTPAFDTDPNTALDEQRPMQAGSYDFFIRADGYGHARVHANVQGSTYTLRVLMAENVAAGSRGAIASGPGLRLEKLIDETEATNWESTGNQPTIDQAQPAVRVALAGGARDITRVQVSGILQNIVGEGGQNRYSSIHQFALAACDSASADCGNDASYSTVYTSPDGAFPSANFRPIVSHMTLREFRLAAPVHASHLRFVVLHNKCSGTPAYHGYLGVPGQEDADAANNTDCRVENTTKFPRRNTDVRVAELQVYSADARLLLEAIGTIPDQTHVEGQTIAPLATAANFNEPSGLTLTYSVTGLPAGLSLHPTTGLITGTLTGNSAGVYNVVVTATDPDGFTATQAFTWTVTELQLPGGGIFADGFED